MKKKKIFLMTLSTLMCVGAGGGLYLLTFNNETKVLADGEKEIKYINIGYARDHNANLMQFETSLESIPTDMNDTLITWYVNNKVCESYSVNADKTNSENKRIYFTYSGNQPSYEKKDTNNYYTHYLIKAGTTIISTPTTNYVLEKDYSFWSTKYQNNDTFGYFFQNGGYDDARLQANANTTPKLTSDNGAAIALAGIYSLKFTSFGGGDQEGSNITGDEYANRFLMLLNYEETSDVKFTHDAGEIYNCPIYIDKGNGYVLSDNTTTRPVIWANGKISNTTNDQLLFLLRYKDLFDDCLGNETLGVIKMERSYYSFYIPKYTLWGGVDAPFMIEDDYYFEITQAKVKDESINETDAKHFHGFYTTPHDYECVSGSYYKCARATHADENEFFIKNADGTYTSVSSDVTKKAIEWASDFLSKTATPCKNLDANSFKSDSELWTGFNTSYTALSDTAKTIIKNNPYSNEDITNAIERYNYIVKKYNVTDFINGSTSSGSKTITRMPISNDVVLLVTIIAIVGISSISGYLLLRKKKQ